MILKQNVEKEVGILDKEKLFKPVMIFKTSRTHDCIPSNKCKMVYENWLPLTFVISETDVLANA